MWFKKEKPPKEPRENRPSKVPEGLWVKCDGCRQILYNKELARSFKICPKCGFHFRLSAPERLRMLFDGRALAGIGRRETARRIAYVPQSADLVFPIRSLDLVLQGRAPHGRGFSADSPEDRRRAREAMLACDVAGLEERDASALSGGERRRVFLARALAQEAELWLLDEPTSGLDPRHRFEFLEVLVREHRVRATTVLLVTHDIDLAAGLADRVILLRDGRALAEGPPEESLTPETIREAFSVAARVEKDPAGRVRVFLEGK